MVVKIVSITGAVPVPGAGAAVALSASPARSAEGEGGEALTAAGGATMRRGR